MKAIKIILEIILPIWVYPLSAQHTGITVFGNVLDAHHEVMEGAAVVLKKAVDSTYVMGTVTDSCGMFTFTHVKVQKYLLEFSMLGCKKQYIYALLDRNQTLPAVILEEDAQQLSAVTVTGKRTFMQMNPGSITFNMEAMVLGTQGNILDALRSLPGVMVNEDGSVILNGQAGIQVLINGKSTYLSGDKLINYLRAMPVSAIKDIELITSPSAKYDASGKTGLIDIRTHKVTIEGWTVQANGGYQQSHDGKWNLGGRLTYQKNKLGLFLDYSHNQGKYQSTLDIIRKFNEHSFRKDISQFAQMKDHNQGDWARIGANYDINDKFSFEISTDGTLFSKHTLGNTNALFHQGDMPVDSSLFTRNFTRMKQQALSGGALLNYKDEKGRTGDFSFNYLLHRHDEVLSILNETKNRNEQVINQDTLRGNLNSNIRMYSTQANWSMLLPGKIKLDSGVKFTWVDLDNEALYDDQISGQWIPDNEMSNRYEYNENMNAAYIQLNGQIGKFGIDAGLRLEQTRISGKEYPLDPILKDFAYEDSYVHLFPTFTVLYNIPKTPNSLSILYNKRIIRPNYRDLSPFNYIWDDYTSSTGNPNLRAELTDNIEFAYIHHKIYRATVFYSYTKGPIMQNIEISEDNKAIIYPENFKNNSRIGIRLEAGDLIQMKWWRLSANAALYHSLYKWKEMGETVEKKLFTPSVSANSQFLFPAGFNAEISGFYNGRMAFGQSTINPHWSVSIAIQKKIWNDKLTIRLFANDLFQTNRQNLNLELPGNMGRVLTKQFNDYRCIGLSVSMNLKQGKQSKKSMRDMSIDQSKRINL